MGLPNAKVATMLITAIIITRRLSEDKPEDVVQGMRGSISDIDTNYLGDNAI